MKKLIFILIGIILLVLFLMLAMFLFNICPPKGPWSMPPWCKTAYAINNYQVEVNPSKISQIKAVNMYDTWGRNYNMGMFETTQANIESSFERVKEIGAQEVYVHDFDRAVYEKGQNYSSTGYKLEDDVFSNDMRDESISIGDLKKLADAAHKNGLKIGIKRNLTFIDMKELLASGLSGSISSDVQNNFIEFNKSHSEEWIKDYFKKWQERLVEKAKNYSQAGIDIMSVSPTFQTPQFSGHEALANELWKNLIAEVKKYFKGQVVAELDIYGLVDGNNGAEDWTKYDYYKSADIIETRVYKILEKYQSADKNNIKEDIARMVSGINNKAREKDIKLSVFFAPSSYEQGLYNGPVEFLDINNAAIKNLKKDYEVQAQAFDYFFQAIKNSNNITRLNCANFAWDDALDPEITPKVSISASFRNKPAESVIKAWFIKQ
jgi:hypothetical protein